MEFGQIGFIIVMIIFVWMLKSYYVKRIKHRELICTQKYIKIASRLFEPYKDYDTMSFEEWEKECIKKEDYSFKTFEWDEITKWELGYTREGGQSGEAYKKKYGTYPVSIDSKLNILIEFNNGIIVFAGQINFIDIIYFNIFARKKATKKNLYYIIMFFISLVIFMITFIVVFSGVHISAK